MPKGKVKKKCQFSILNYQPPPEDGFVEVTDIKIWSTDLLYLCFNDFVKQNIEQDVRKQIIINGQTRSSSRFKIFNHLKSHVRSDKLKVGRKY